MNKISFKAILAVMLPITVAGCGTTHKMKFADYTEANWLIIAKLLTGL